MVFILTPKIYKDTTNWCTHKTKSAHFDAQKMTLEANQLISLLQPHKQQAEIPSDHF
jgi:hypothetical protein